MGGRLVKVIALLGCSRGLASYCARLTRNDERSYWELLGEEVNLRPDGVVDGMGVALGEDGDVDVDHNKVLISIDYFGYQHVFLAK